MEAGRLGVGEVGLHAVAARVAHGRRRSAEETGNEAARQMCYLAMGAREVKKYRHGK